MRRNGSPPNRRGTAGSGSSTGVARLLLGVLLSGVLIGHAARADEVRPPVWGDVLLATSQGAILPRSLEAERSITAAFAPLAAVGERRDARAALMTSDAVVLLVVITLADDRTEHLQVPLTTHETIHIYLDQLILGGSVIAFSPLSRSIMTTAPLLGARVLRLPEQAPPQKLQQEALTAAIEFARLARERGQSISARSRAAPVHRRTLAPPLLDAGRKDGVLPGTVISVVDRAAGTGVECTATSVDAERSELICPGPVPEHPTGLFLRSTGAGAERYAVRHASITSAKARDLLRDSIAADETMAAFAAADTLAGAGVTVLPPGGTEGERLATKGVRQFAAAHGITAAELEKFSVNFPPAEVQVDVLVDGYNTQIVSQGPIKRVRAHKAWATVSDDRGHSIEGIGVEHVEEVEGWQADLPQAADARQAIRKAVACATNRLLGNESKDCLK